MTCRVLAFILVLTAIGTIPVHGNELTDTHYNITSSLDYPRMTLVEHAQIVFQSDSLSTDSLVFWRSMLDRYCEMQFDSIFIKILN